MTPTVLIIEDDRDTCDSLADLLKIRGYVTEKADCLKTAQNIFETRQIDAVLLDMNLPDGNGLDLVIPLRTQHPHMAIILITGLGDIPTAVQAMRSGADHFLSKPVNPEELIIFLDRSLDVEHLRRSDSVRRRLSQRARIYRADSGQMRNAWSLAKTAAENESAVLLLGETGTGKGVFAKWIHENGVRQREAFVELNCSMLRGELLASELFGHRKGSFTSAVEDREGLIEMANKGTLFLDEIGDMDLAVQAQFLKVVEEKEFRRVGESKCRRSDFRLICATNKNLTTESEQGRFRKDLYFRTCIFPVEIPPLREYLEDLPGLVDHLLASLGRHGVTVKPEAMQILQDYSWPGNLRELRNVLERACLLTKSDSIGPSCLVGLEVQEERETLDDSGRVDWRLEDQEVLHLRRALAHFQGDVARTTKELGISRSTFYRKLKGGVSTAL